MASIRWKEWNGDECLELIVKACGVGIDEWLELVKSISQREVPLDEGSLMKSCYIMSKISKTKIDGSISYGGGSGTGIPRIPYAVRWHFEDANFQHGRKNNYLKDPTYNNISKIQDFCKKRIGGVL